MGKVATIPVHFRGRQDGVPLARPAAQGSTTGQSTHPLRKPFIPHRTTVPVRAAVRSKAGVGRKVQMQDTRSEDREEEHNGQVWIPPPRLPVGGVADMQAR